MLTRNMYCSSQPTRSIANSLSVFMGKSNAPKRRLRLEESHTVWASLLWHGLVPLLGILTSFLPLYSAVGLGLWASGWRQGQSVIVLCALIVISSAVYTLTVSVQKTGEGISVESPWPNFQTMRGSSPNICKAVVVWVFMVHPFFLAGPAVYAQKSRLTPRPSRASPPPGSTHALVKFVDVTSASGVHFLNVASHTSKKYLPETMGSGVALFDYDNDGRLDIFFVNGAPLTDPTAKGAIPQKSGPKDWNRLYHQKQDGTFEDVTERAGLQGVGYGMGVASADYDNDGYEDLYVTSYGGNKLYHNNGDGTFTDVTEKAGVGASGWSTSAAWVDLDADGLLDLVVLRYLSGTLTTSGAASIAMVIAPTAIPIFSSQSRRSSSTMTAMATSPKYPRRSAWISPGKDLGSP